LLIGFCKKNKHANLAKALRSGCAPLCDVRAVASAAAVWGSVDCIRALAQAGFDINETIDSYGNTAILSLCKSPLVKSAEKVAALRALLKMGASLSIHKRCLHAAVVSEQDPSITECLLHGGFSPNALNLAKETALELAVVHNRPREQRLLLDHGANPDAAVEAALTVTNGPAMRTLVSMGAKIPPLFDLVACKRDPIYFGRANLDMLVSSMQCCHLERRLSLLLMIQTDH
jgi:ankyrin repeat protein